MEVALPFLKNKSLVSSSSQAAAVSSGRYSRRVPVQVTGLHLAARFGLQGLLPGLLEGNEYADSKDSNGRTPLSYAVESGHKAVVELLLENAVDVDSRDSRGWTPLSWAIMNRHEAVVKLLLQKGADTEMKSYGDNTPLTWAIETGSEAVSGLLLAKSTTVNYCYFVGSWYGSLRRSRDERHALSVWASNVGQQVYWESLGWIHQDLARWRTPLSHAAERGCVGVVKLLLAQPGIDVDFGFNRTDRTPLSYAVAEGYEEVVTMLLEMGAKPYVRDINCRTPLSWAAEKGHETVMRLLVEKGADVNAENVHGWTALHSAANRGHVTVVRLLIEKGADVNAKTKGGVTVLHRAASNGHKTVVRLIVEKRADIGMKNSDGWAALHLAISNGQEAVVQLLAEKDSTINGQGRECGKALLMAAYKGKRILLRLLTKTGIDVDVHSDVFRDLLQLGCIQGHMDIVEELLLLGAKPNSVDEHGWTPLFCASRFQQGAILDRLVLAGGDEQLSTHVKTLPPTSWSQINKSARLQLDENEMCVRYIGSASLIDPSICNDADDMGTDVPAAAAARANHPIPLENACFYFEITVLDGGEDGTIGLGLCSGHTSLNAFPGWKSSSWGYHGDNGKAYAESDTGTPYGETFGAGDVIGCLIISGDGVVFTKNGASLGFAFRGVSGKLYPVVGLHSRGACIRVNFGQEQFRYDASSSGKSP
ncbi:MAG: hypothetical protein M1813_008873 [Trichoglossum hirsutum]|nr:MAG: hypothetical protein M1813_008873 [Trichoglossum hirsutum]